MEVSFLFSSLGNEIMRQVEWNMIAHECDGANVRAAFVLSQRVFLFFSHGNACVSIDFGLKVHLLLYSHLP